MKLSRASAPESSGTSRPAPTSMSHLPEALPPQTPQTARPPLATDTLLNCTSLPAVVVDLTAVEANARDMLRRANGMPIRVASKSIRIPQLISHVLAFPGFQGVLAYSLAEALYLFR